MLFGVISTASGKTLDTIDVITQCPECKDKTPITLESQAWYNYMHRGEFIQNAFQSYHASVREMLQTGIDPACWALIMTSPEEEDDPIPDQDNDPELYHEPDSYYAEDDR